MTSNLAFANSFASVGFMLVSGAIAFACTTTDPNEVVLSPRPKVEVPSGATLEESLVADLQNPNSTIYTDEAAHRALLAKAFEEVPGLKERIETISKTLATSHGVSEANPRLVTASEGALHLKDMAPAAGGVARPAGARCAAAVGFGAAYAYAWACRQCASGETVCASAYAYAYAWAFAWVCASEPPCSTTNGGDAGTNGDAATTNDGSAPDASDASVDGPDATQTLDAAAQHDADTVDAKIDGLDSGQTGDTGMP